MVVATLHRRRVDARVLESLCRAQARPQATLSGRLRREKGPEVAPRHTQGYMLKLKDQDQQDSLKEVYCVCVCCLVGRPGYVAQRGRARPKDVPRPELSSRAMPMEPSFAQTRSEWLGVATSLRIGPCACGIGRILVLKAWRVKMYPAKTLADPDDLEAPIGGGAKVRDGVVGTKVQLDCDT